MKYYYLKLGAGNCEADARLSGSPPTAAVYFDDCTEADYDAGRGKGQARLFWKCGKQDQRDKTVIVVIHRGRIWMLQPIGEVKFSEPYQKDDTGLTTKEMPVRILKEAWCKDVPPVLAGIANSQHHGRRTFTLVNHWGNMKAIDSVLGRIASPEAAKDEHWDPKQQGAAQLVECLGSTELETLVGKLFEAHGCHVPAYLGGTLRDIDIFAYNDSPQPIAVGEIMIPAGARISIQVKTWSGWSCPSSVDYLIGIDAIPGTNSFNAEWLLDRVKESPSVARWLKRSLSWLPPEYLARFGL